MLQVFLLFSQALIWAIPVDFYSTVSSSGDTNMIKMTTDLFYNQFQSIDGYTVIDRRNTVYDKENAGQTTIAFYAEINEASDGSWICTLNAIKADERRNFTTTKKYASYYKILLDAKNSLENLLSNLSEDFIPELQSSGTFADTNQEEEKTLEEHHVRQEHPRSINENKVSMDSLAGTWEGEDFIEKILILRGGRGFVIFKNGANMNVSINIDGGNVSVVQTTSTNASFFPEISRNLALSNAPFAKPVEWTLHLDSPGHLSGTKKTLLEDEASSTGVQQGTIQVTWKKK